MQYDEQQYDADAAIELVAVTKLQALQQQYAEFIAQDGDEEAGGAQREGDEECESSDAIDMVKATFQGKEGFPPVQQRLTFAEQTLDGSQTLADYNVGMEVAAGARVKPQGFPDNTNSTITIEDDVAGMTHYEQSDTDNDAAAIDRCKVIARRLLAHCTGRRDAGVKRSAKKLRALLTADVGEDRLLLGVNTLMERLTSEGGS